MQTLLEWFITKWWFLQYICCVRKNTWNTAGSGWKTLFFAFIGGRMKPVTRADEGSERCSWKPIDKRCKAKVSFSTAFTFRIEQDWKIYWLWTPCTLECLIVLFYLKLWLYNIDWKLLFVYWTTFFRGPNTNATSHFWHLGWSHILDSMKYIRNQFRVVFGKNK